MEYPVLKLTRPIVVKGENVTELAYDMDGMTAMDTMDAMRARLMRFDNIPPLVGQLDEPLHFCEFCVACRKAMPDMEVADLERMSRADYRRAAKLFAEGFTD